jgi:hypothetical protein
MLVFGVVGGGGGADEYREGWERSGKEEDVAQAWGEGRRRMEKEDVACVEEETSCGERHQSRG